MDFENVTFKYGDQTVLKDIDLHVEPGQVIAVMGATGMGKTSLVTLLGRYYDVVLRQPFGGRRGRAQAGSAALTQQHRRGDAGNLPVFAKPSPTTSASAARTQRRSRWRPPRAPRRRRSSSCRTPQGYDTVIGERGMGLSGGQKQRVALARAILYDPSILVLDDATSAVDMETEAEIQKALAKVLKGRTTFIIAHRISSVRKADQIVMLEDGRIAERGTHRELLRKDGVYAALFRDQTRDFDTTGKAGDETWRSCATWTTR